MRNKIIFAVLVLLFPLATVLYFALEGATVALLHNSGTQDTTVSLVIAGNGTFERTADKPLSAGGTTLVIFFPRTSGALRASCVKDGIWRGFSLGQDTPQEFRALALSLDSCDRLDAQHGFAL